MFIRLCLIFALVPLQSCSNTVIGEKLAKSFETSNNTTIPEKTIKAIDQNKLKEVKKITLRRMDEEKENESIKGNITKENSKSNKDRFSQKSTKSSKKVIFNPQPYRIILKLSGANPSAPAESVTQALRKAGVEFEVEKIERYDEKSLLNDSSFKRKEF